ncbi:hypothetical protein B005_4643 [Nocardiopsis alba ATCC BAA-2165]|uniref:Uncharacterized protein n=1 Tax=Nocardiopsis alba (strain ATCC BAA-2165 / BE74) TaxID=1205910 RepID=J7L200_NOCAA|nr:hypothetical protein B005_4643 [Nocardiopsis alba ATCC BAA-2165]
MGWVWVGGVWRRVGVPCLFGVGVGESGRAVVADCSHVIALCVR